MGRFGSWPSHDPALAANHLCSEDFTCTASVHSLWFLLVLKIVLNTGFPRVISLCRIRLRLDFFFLFWCLIKFKSRYLPYAAGRKGCLRFSILSCMGFSVPCCLLGSYPGRNGSGPPSSAFHFGLVLCCKGSTVLAWGCWWSKEHPAPGKVFPFLLNNIYECNWCLVWNAPGQTGNAEQRVTLFGWYFLISVAVGA